MLSNATLERVSTSYRRGYLDGRSGRPDVGAGIPSEQIRPFAEFDYAEGYRAGANDRRWADTRAREAAAIDLRKQPLRDCGHHEYDAHVEPVGGREMCRHCWARSTSARLSGGKFRCVEAKPGSSR